METGPIELNPRQYASRGVRVGMLCGFTLLFSRYNADTPRHIIKFRCDAAAGTHAFRSRAPSNPACTRYIINTILHQSQPFQVSRLINQPSRAHEA